MSLPQLVLASQSPRRRELLTMLGISHVVDPVELDESLRPEEEPAIYATRLAREKALAGSARHSGEWVLGADTVVVVDQDILGKPESPEDAERMLTRLIGREHRVITAVALSRNGIVHEAKDETAVWMRAIDKEAVRRYVQTGEPLDKAGSYGIQGFGSILVERIEGDYFSVMGLPVRLVVDLMALAGIPYNFTS